jgi:DNA primase
MGRPTDNAQAIEEVFGEKKSPATTGSHEFQEKDIARILIAGGGQVFDAEHNVTVAQFVLSNLEDVMHDFDNKLYQRVAQEALNFIQKGTPLSSQHFLSHQNKEIREFAASILSSPYDYSSNWEEKYHRPLETQKHPDINFDKDSVQSLKRFKLKKIIKMCEHNQEIIRKANDSGDMGTMMKHLKVQQKLMDMRNQLAKELNTVVLK